MTSWLGRLQLSDQEPFRRLAADRQGKRDTVRLAETYDSYKDLQKEHVARSKHCFVAAALLLASQLNAINELGAFGAKIREGFIPMAALIYVSISTIIFTNFELKMRVYRDVCGAELEGMDAGSHLVTMMRYPPAFYGDSFAAPYILRKTHTISTKDFFFSVPLLLASWTAKAILLLSGIFATVTVFLKVARLSDQDSSAKYVVLAALIAASVFSAAS